MVLNIMPLNLMARMFFELSAALSLFYCFLAFCEGVRIIWNYFHPSKDWGNRTSSVPLTRLFVPQQFSVEMIIYFIAILLLVLIFPFFHI